MPVLENLEQTNRIVEILRNLNEERSVEERYVGVNIPQLPEFCNDIQLEGNCYEQNVNLKFRLSEKFRDENISDEQRAQLGFWIVKKWGHVNIRTPGENAIRQDIVNYFAGNQIDIRLRDRIPSRSKVLAFLDPEEYAVCDSKTVFAINWLLYFTHSNDNVGILFQPPSNGNRRIETHYITDYNLNCEITENSYTTYAEYMDVIHTLSEMLGWEIYKTEMLLFKIADDEQSGIIQMIENEEREGHIERIQRTS